MPFDICSDAAIHIALRHHGVKQERLRCVGRNRQESAEINRSRQISPENRPKSAEIDKSHQLSTEVNTLSTGIGAPCSDCSRIIGENTRIARTHVLEHTYWNIKGCGDAARIFIGKFLFFRRKRCGGFCFKCGTNVPPQILPRFLTLRQFKLKEIYGKTQN